jgi:hypothetical protein
MKNISVLAFMLISLAITGQNVHINKQLALSAKDGEVVVVKDVDKDYWLDMDVYLIPWTFKEHGCNKIQGETVLTKSYYKYMDGVRMELLITYSKRLDILTMLYSIAEETSAVLYVIDKNIEN